MFGISYPHMVLANKNDVFIAVSYRGYNGCKLGGKWVLIDTQTGIFYYGFTEDEFERYSAIAYDYNHIGPVYLKHIRGMRQ